jgi:hypothetical protein
MKKFIVPAGFIAAGMLVSLTDYASTSLQPVLIWLGLLQIAYIAVREGLKKVFRGAKNIASRSSSDEQELSAEELEKLMVENKKRAMAIDENEENQRFLKLGKTQDVIRVFESIENKIYETGKLVSLTGDNEADITITPEIYDGGPHLFIKIHCNKNDVPESDAEAFQDYVSEKFDDLKSSQLSDEAQEIFDNLWGWGVFINDEQVY